MFNSKKRVKDLSAPGAAAGAAGGASTTAAVAGGVPGLGPTSAGNIQKLEMAKRLALKINAQKNLGAEAQVCQTEMKYVCAGVIVFTAKHGIQVLFRDSFSLHGTDEVKWVFSSCTGRDAAGHQRHPTGRHHHDTLGVSQDHCGAAGGEDQCQTELHPRGEVGGGATGG